ncbi:hypothetical protein EXIGLDRAFT_413418 [Exidia glandulosa HHB12029]|uniref:Uncharacterized protein n=1 Tax=Exidia glandulosa HHB12029 TaxID=1314781 RepID=A0A165BER9_EXIGL|nr:hypothetical protein EXIGLDRAFT_413418 [Exidia glandulosa HHB12029]
MPLPPDYLRSFFIPGGLLSSKCPHLAREAWAVSQTTSKSYHQRRANLLHSNSYVLPELTLPMRQSVAAGNAYVTPGPRSLSARGAPEANTGPDV